MKQSTIKQFIVAIAVVAGIGLIGFPNESETTIATIEAAEYNSPKIPMRDRADLANAQNIEMIRDLTTGEVPTERLLEAKKYADQLRATHRAPLTVNWTERGPNNVGGRTRAILVDPNDGGGNTVFAASVAGGLFKTTNIAAANPAWVAVDEFFANLAITCLAYDPSSPLTMYFGTGEGYLNSDAVRGNGVWKSTDAGNTWSQLASTTTATFRFCQRIAVTPTGTVLVATSSGLMRSTNGGASFTKVLGTGLGITGAGSNMCWDVDIAADGSVFGCLDGSIHKSTNDGATFGAAQALPVTPGRIELACAPSDANYAYAILEGANQVNRVVQTVNGGGTWNTRSEPADADTGIPNTDCSRGQAWYDLSIDVDPNNRNRLYMGGVDLFVSGDGANTWTQVSHWYGGFGFQEVHADQHIALYAPGNSNIIYFGNDGGIYRSTNAAAANPTITGRNFGYNVTQFYGIAMHPGANVDHFLAGAQDNGSQRFTSGGVNTTVEVTGGDGAFCNIDQTQPQFQFTQYVYNNFRRSVDGGNTFVNVDHGNNGRFINPSDYDDVNNIMYAARGNNQYLRWNDPQTGNSFTAVTATLGGTVSALKVSPNTNNRVFFGTGSGTVVRVDNAHATPTSTDITAAAMPAGYISCVEVETGDDNHILVSFSNYGVNSIWETFNGGTSWTSVEGNLPDMPVRWILLNPNDNSQALIATELGVWYTDNLSGGSTVWFPGNTGLANVRTDMLQTRASDNLVIAGTHGRGLYSSDVFTVPTALFSANRELTYTTKAVQFTNDSYRSTSWTWNFGDGSPTSNLENPSHIYSTPGKYNVTLTINGGASTLTKNAFIHVLPDRGTPYLPAAGGNFEVNLNDFGANNISGTAFERGNSVVAGKNGFVSASNSWVTALVGNYADNAECQLWVPSYNMTAAGTYTLGFSSRFNTEASYDGFRVEYSLDKGDNWVPLGTTTAANWYNNPNTAGTTSFPANQAFFSGNVSASFVNYSRDISFLAGNSSVAFRFVFRSDVSVTAAGAAIDDFFINGPSNGPSGLPVQASVLQGEWDGENVRLTWETYQETNSLMFNLERSTDGISFTDIGSLNAAGNSTETLPYAFDDYAVPQGRLFYRYRQIDVDGSSRYSNIVELNSNESLAAIKVFPNPFSSYLEIVAGIEKHEQSEIHIWTLDGKHLCAIRPNFVGGVARIDIPESIPNGMCLLEVRVGAKKWNRVMLKK